MSVLIGLVSRNRAEILPKAINSALRQRNSDIEVAVFDDNSSDNTFLLKDKFPDVQWEFSKENKGYVFARNKLMKEAGTEYFCSLDDDSWFINDNEIEKAISYLDTHSNVAAVAFDILSPDQPDQKVELLPNEVGMFIGCGHILRLSAAREVNYYDPNPSFYGGEEKDICLKLINKGYQIMLMPGIHVWHEKTTVARNIKAQHYSGVCNDLVFLYRRAPLVILIPGLIVKIAKHLSFSFHYKQENIFIPGVKGILRFFVLLFTFNLIRSPVSLNAFRKFRILNRQSQ
jgi:GT2 family glycosyltransferase